MVVCVCGPSSSRIQQTHYSRTYIVCQLLIMCVDLLAHKTRSHCTEDQRDQAGHNVTHCCCCCCCRWTARDIVCCAAGIPLSHIIISTTRTHRHTPRHTPILVHAFESVVPLECNEFRTSVHVRVRGTVCADACFCVYVLMLAHTKYLPVARLCVVPVPSVRRPAETVTTSVTTKQCAFVVLCGDGLVLVLHICWHSAWQHSRQNGRE